MSMVNPLLVGAALYGLACTYEKYVPPDLKRKFENWIKSHHGEWGALGMAGGILTNSPNLFSAGIALAFHDRKDGNKWFKHH